MVSALARTVTVMETTTTSATFTISSWDETPPWDGAPIPRPARATICCVLQGGIAGRSSIEYALGYATPELCVYSGFELVEATVDGRFGSFLLRHDGRFEEGAATARLSIVEGSATGELRGLRGAGTARAPQGNTGEIELKYSLTPPASERDDEVRTSGVGGAS